MKTSIDSAGRLVIPKEIRRQAGWRAGTLLEVCWRDGRVEIEPALVPMTFQREGRFVVAIPLEDGPPLTAIAVEQVRDAVVREREQQM
jgi:AbrB family looped-hinge helix DNA binding protein